MSGTWNRSQDVADTSAIMNTYELTNLEAVMNELTRLDRSLPERELYNLYSSSTRAKMARSLTNLTRRYTIVEIKCHLKNSQPPVPCIQPESSALHL
jgi:hypothetical protein